MRHVDLLLIVGWLRYRHSVRLPLRVLVLSLAFAWAWFPESAARADVTNVVVLGIRSVEGDDDFGRTVTDALRHEIRQIRTFRVLPNDVSLAQIMLALGCDDADAACLARVASELHAQRVIYGTMRRTSATERFSYAVEFFAFNADSGEIENTVADAIPRALADVDNIRQKVRAWVAILAGVPSVGSLRVRANVDAPAILLNGEPMGSGHGGVFTSDRVAAGAYLLEVAADGYRTFRQRVTIGVGSEVEIAADLVPEAAPPPVVVETTGVSAPSPSSAMPGAFFAGVGVAVAGVGAVVGGVYSVARVDAINGDPDFLAYRRVVPSGFDACAAANANPPNDYGFSMSAGASRFQRVRSLCSEGGTLEILEVVLLSLGVAMVGTGTYLMVANLDVGDTSPPVRAMVAPRVSLTEASLELRIEM